MIRKFKRWIELSQEQASAVPSCDKEGSVNDRATVDELEPKEESGNDVINDDVMRATAAPGCNNEEVAAVGKLELKEELCPNEHAYSNGVAENSAGEVKPPEATAGSGLQPSPEGKTLNAESQGACKGATSSVKIAPDYPLFPVSRGFCLSLGRALESFQTALEKAGLVDCSEKP